jgi:predicted nucleotidyltransferase
MSVATPASPTTQLCRAAFPTTEHRRVAFTLAEVFFADPAVRAVLLSGSLARGRGAATSCVDLTVMVPPEDFETFANRIVTRVEALRDQETRPVTFPKGCAVYFSLAGQTVASVEGVGDLPASIRADVDYHDGVIEPDFYALPREDDFELAAGNLAVYSVPILERDGWWTSWRRRFLPYFDENVREAKRLAVEGDFWHNIRAVREMADRGLLFHGVERVIYAFRYLIQGLFLAQGKYPIDYMKHLEEQVVDILGRPELLPELAKCFDFGPALTPDGLRARADHLADLFRSYYRA